MKSILFLSAYPLSIKKKYNLTSKFDGQMNAMINMGYDVWFTGFDEGIVYLCHNDVKIRIGKTHKWDQNIIQIRGICKYMSDIVKIKKFDLCYMRFAPVIPEIVKALQILKNNNSKVIIEIPTYPWRSERKRDKRFLFNFIIVVLSFLFEKKMQKYVDLYTLIGEKASEYCGVKAINISNGVNPDSYPLKTWRLPSNEIHLLALAKMAYWHGYDRIIEGLRIYYSEYELSKPRIILHLVGNDADGSLEIWKKLIYKYNLEKHVFFEGIKMGKDLDELFDICDLGVSSLGFYRQNLNNTSSLKVSEFCARGLPFVYSAKNEFFYNNPNFCLEVPNNDSYICIKEIIEFTNSVRDIKNISIKMRNFSIENMTWEKQFYKIIKSLN